MPKVSVVIPVYNCAGLIDKSLDSVLNQTYKDYEIIIVNDGSTDATESVLTNYIKKYPGIIKCFTQENGGSAKARNTAIAHSQGEYIAFLDSDDIWTVNKLEKQMKVIDKDRSINFVFSNARLINHIGEDLNRLYINGDVDVIRTYPLFDQLLLKNYIPLSSIVIKRDILNSLGGFEENLWWCEDYNFLLRVVKKVNVFEMQEELVLYRLSLQSKSKNLLNRHKETTELINKYRPGCITKNQRFNDLIRKRLSACYFGLGYAYYEENQLLGARKAFSQSMVYSPLHNLKKYFLYLISFLPLSWIEILRNFKKGFSKHA